MAYGLGFMGCNWGIMVEGLCFWVGGSGFGVSG
jgi:hypothetical protein